MTSLLRVLAALGAALALAACATVPPAPPPAPLTLLISVDGYRADYLDRGLTPNIAALAADGVRARAMRSSFPTLTFPNHYTLVTGLRPDRHGVVDNTMEDPRRPGVVFRPSNRAAATDPFWWDAATPLWITAEQAGIRTATMFWPGSEVELQGRRPSQWRPYDKSVRPDQRVDQVLAWLDAPADRRPKFVTLYFDEVDTQGHKAGPESPAVNDALVRTDAAIGRLVEGLKARGLYDGAEIVVVSDHGMAPISPERAIWLDDLLPGGGYRAVTLGPTAGLFAEPAAEKALLGRHGHMSCWRKGAVPERLHYGRNPRIPPVVCLADTGWLIETRAAAQGYAWDKGAHGFDPDDPLMAALFVAHGPAFRRGVVQPPFDNVDVYPLLARLIGVKPLANDGRLADLAPALAR